MTVPSQREFVRSMLAHVPTKELPEVAIVDLLPNDRTLLQGLDNHQATNLRSHAKKSTSLGGSKDSRQPTRKHAVSKSHPAVDGALSFHPDHGRYDDHSPPAGVEGTDSQQTKIAPSPIGGPSAAPNLPQEHRHSRTDDHRSSAMLLWDPLLQTLASGLDDIESARIAQANRYRILTAVEADDDGELRGFGLDEGHPAVAALSIQLSTLVDLEKGMVKALQKQLKSHPLHPWIKAQTGLGDKQVSRLLAAIRDPYWNDLHDRPRTVSELWAYSGLHVLPAATRREFDIHSGSGGGGVQAGGDTSHSASGTQMMGAGVAPARRRGQKINWNNEARTRIYVIAESCMKNRNSPYRAVYDDGREKYAESVHNSPCAQCGKKGQPAIAGTELRDGHKHARAMRLVMKAILRDLWIESKRIYTGATND